MSEDARTAPWMPRRVLSGLRHRRNWAQLVRFLAVGGSGFVVNIAAYTAAIHLVGLDYRIAAFVGVVAGVSNNFFWHRHWTFGAREGHAGFQAARFIVVYGVTFIIGLGILQALVEADTARVLAQVISQIVITPLNFIGHKLWSFDHGIVRGRRGRSGR